MNRRGLARWMSRRVVLAAVVVLVALVLVWLAGLRTVAAGRWGWVAQGGGGPGRLLTPGWHWVVPWRTVHDLEGRAQGLLLPGRMVRAGGQQVVLTARMLWRVDPAHAGRYVRARQDLPDFEERLASVAMAAVASTLQDADTAESTDLSPVGQDALPVLWSVDLIVRCQQAVVPWGIEVRDVAWCWRVEPGEGEVQCRARTLEWLEQRTERIRAITARRVAELDARTVAEVGEIERQAEQRIRLLKAEVRRETDEIAAALRAACPELEELSRRLDAYRGLLRQRPTIVLEAHDLVPVDGDR